jgi:hypothetical protein
VGARLGRAVVAQAAPVAHILQVRGRALDHLH